MSRNYKTRAEFALYIAEEIEAYHKLDRLGGWSKEEITLVDLAAELRATPRCKHCGDQISDHVGGTTDCMGYAAPVAAHGLTVAEREALDPKPYTGSMQDYYRDKDGHGHENDPISCKRHGCQNQQFHWDLEYSELVAARRRLEILVPLVRRLTAPVDAREGEWMYFELDGVHPRDPDCEKMGCRPVQQGDFAAPAPLEGETPETDAAARKRYNTVSEAFNTVVVLCGSFERRLRAREAEIERMEE